MLYAILCYDSEDVVGSWSKQEDEAVMVRLAAVQDKLAKQGRLGPVARLLPTTAATTVRKSAEPLVLDGPFAETREQLLGFFIVDCQTLDDAIDAGQPGRLTAPAACDAGHPCTRRPLRRHAATGTVRRLLGRACKGKRCDGPEARRDARRSDGRP